MRKWVSLIIIILWTVKSQAQKKPLDHSAYDVWEKITQPCISNDGKFVVYIVKSQIGKATLTVKGVSSSYYRRIIEGYNSTFTIDSRFLVCKIRSNTSAFDTLAILNLRNDSLLLIPNVLSYQTSQIKGEPYIAYETLNATSQADLVLLGLYSHCQLIFPFVDKFQFNTGGDYLILKSRVFNKHRFFNSALLCINIITGKIDTLINKVVDVRNFAFDSSGKRVAFLANVDSTDKNIYSLWYYEIGMRSAILKVDNKTTGVKKGLVLSTSSKINFSANGNKIYFGLTPTSTSSGLQENQLGLPNVNVWRYNDDVLLSQRKVEARYKSASSFASVLNIKSNKVIQLGTNELENTYQINKGDAEYVMSKSIKGSRIKEQWDLAPEFTIDLISTEDGTSDTIEYGINNYISVSPRGKFLIWYDRRKRHYFSYDIEKHILKNISGQIETPLYDDEYDRPEDPPSFGIGAWFANDSSLLIYDRYDIWQVDVTGVNTPVNLTKGFGTKNRTIFRIVTKDEEKATVEYNDLLILKAFDRKNKHSGFFKIRLKNNSKLEMLSMGPYAYTFVSKAEFDSTYIVGIMNAQEPCNIYCTKDFRKFTRISDINTQQNEYTWMTAELFKWKRFNGMEGEGILYKPENFDPNKKYPVIFYLYEKSSDHLYEYIPPEPSDGRINITYFVSNGYLVFQPNIYFEIGKPGMSVYYSVMSAASKLLKYSWINAKKLGIQGHSFGGYGVNYLISRTNLFCAASSSSAETNMVSGYGDIRDDGRSRQFQYEHGQNRIGRSFWSDPQLYIVNSPFFDADKVETPLLIMHNKNDGTVPWSQAFGYFTALRRLGKKVWMLDYEKEDHWLNNRKNQKDFSIRISEFFEYYLKDGLFPEWLDNKGQN